MPIWRKGIKAAVGIGRAVVASGPVLLPATLAVQDGIVGGPQAGFNTFIFEASGYNLNAKQLDTGKLTEVIIRDAVFLGLAAALGYASKRV